MSESNSSKLITFRFNRFIALTIGNNDYIELPFEEAMLISEIDKEESLVHVEQVTKENGLSKPQVWNVTNWRKSLIRREKARKLAEENRIEFENYKENINRIIERLDEELLYLPLSTLEQMAVDILRKNPDTDKILGVELKKPYYKGVYVILPCRKAE